jgi:hypothetical protein
MVQRRNEHRPKIARRTALALLAGMVLAAPVAAEQPSAQGLLDAIYRPYLKKGHDGPPFEKYPEIFVPDLFRAIDRDATEAKRQDIVPTLSGDAFLDAGGPDPITNLAIDVAVNGAKATGTVTFTIRSEVHGVDRRHLTIDLVQTPSGWRIFDIVSKRDFGKESLRALFKLR